MSETPKTGAESAAAVREWISEAIHREIGLPKGVESVTVETALMPSPIRSGDERSQIGTDRPDTQVIADRIEVIVRAPADADAVWLRDLGPRLESLAGADGTLGTRVRDGHVDSVQGIEREFSPDFGDDAQRLGLSMTVYRVGPRTPRGA